MEESDVVIMVGTRLDNQMNFGNPPLFPTSTHLVCVNGSHEEIELNRSADQALLSDPGAFFSALGALEPLAPDWIETNRAWRLQWVEDMIADIPQLDDDRIHPLQLAIDVQAAMNDGDWLVIDGGNTHFWSEISVNIAGHRGLKLGNILHPGTFSMLGVGVPFASVAKLNNPDKSVVVISGDGAFLSGGSSIEAAFQEKLPIVVVIDNNGGLDCISQQQERLFSKQQHFATDFRDIPFHSMFEGLGGYGELVEKRADIIPAVKRAIASGKTACVNVKTVGHISPIVLATTSKRDKASIE
jgi:acetolactate synthase-1/2/3 large subunit